ncbi:hypothetical protein JQX13_01450 [Archangium violaceum]|uniref:hypothetical protein n=1 Tax=Archangium violaceum TaxID=83451 RepID=UPI00193B7AFB|nr:hypothetical protein [Archangium violaceum]QRK08866.1 hypothetical protein JQX13_01450 [Archangium violaceum]
MSWFDAGRTPTEYTCGACSLKVTLGWFHAHDVSDGHEEEARASGMRPQVRWDVIRDGQRTLEMKGGQVT